METPEARATTAPAEADAAVGDGVIAAVGVGVLLVGLTMLDTPDLLGGLLLLLLLAVLTVVATYTAVMGRHRSWFRRSLAVPATVAAVAVIVLQAEHVYVIAIPLAAVGAGLGRTPSWRLRLVGLVAPLAWLAIAWLVGLSGT